jgi:hypothetical protein
LPLQGKLYNIIHSLLNDLYSLARAFDALPMTSRGLPPRMNRLYSVADLSKVAANPATKFLFQQAQRKIRAAHHINMRERLRPRNIPNKPIGPWQAAPTQARYSLASRAAPPQTLMLASTSIEMSSFVMSPFTLKCACSRPPHASGRRLPRAWPSRVHWRGL